MDITTLPALLRQEIASLLGPAAQQRLKLVSPSLAFSVQEACNKGGCAPFQVECYEYDDPTTQPLPYDDDSQELLNSPWPVSADQIDSIDTSEYKVLLILDCEACLNIPNTFQPVERVGTGAVILRQSFSQFRPTYLLLQKSHLVTEIADFAFSFHNSLKEIACVEDVISWNRSGNATSYPLLHPHPRTTTPFPNVTTVGQGFLTGFGGDTLDVEWLFGSSGALISVGVTFLNSSSIACVRIGGAFRNLTSFPGSCFSNCSRLMVVDWETANLNNITEILPCFCVATKLESFTFPRSLSNVRKIGGLFLARCRDLVFVDMRVVAPVVCSLGFGFLQGCVKLRKLLVNPSTPSTNYSHTVDGFPWSLPNLKLIKPSALEACESLRCDVSVPSTGAPIDFLPTDAFRSAGFTSIAIDGDDAPRTLRDFDVIEDRVLRDCASLVSIRLCSLFKLHNIGSQFASCCGHLSHVTMRGLPALPSIGDNFLERCESLVHLDFRGIGCDKLSDIGNRFLSGCLSLTTILGLNELFANVLRIGSGFMTHCRSISSLDLSSCFENVVSIGAYFLSNCEGLKELTLFDNVTKHFALDSIPDFFMSDCVSLSVINPTLVKGCSLRNQIFPVGQPHRVRAVGSFFMHGCRSLEVIDLSGMLRLGRRKGTLLARLEEGFMSDCTALKIVMLNPTDTNLDDGVNDDNEPFDISEDELHFSNCTFLRRPSQFQPPADPDLHHCSHETSTLHLQIPVVFLPLFNSSQTSHVNDTTTLH